MVWQYCDCGFESLTRNINYPPSLLRSGEGSDWIAHSYRNDRKTIFLYGGDFLLWAELADPNADLGEQCPACRGVILDWDRAMKTTGTAISKLEQMVWHSKGLERAEERTTQ